MTILVAYQNKDKIILGADRAGFRGPHYKVPNVQKIHKLTGDNFYVAWCGSASEMHSFLDWSKTNLPKSNDSDEIRIYWLKFIKYEQHITNNHNKANFTIQSACFLVFENKLFVCDADLANPGTQEYTGLGAGWHDAEVAMRVLNKMKQQKGVEFEPKEIIELTLEITAETNHWTGEGHDIVEIPTHNK